jgi:chromosome transmission fidelity protein 1
MRDVLNECHAVIFCGGTMSPIEGIVDALTDGSMSSRIVCRSFDHIVQPENLQVSILQQGPSKAKFDFTFESRNDGKLIMELGITICNLARVVPRGLVVFFTSFAYLDVVAEVWQQKGIIKSLSAVKKVSPSWTGSNAHALLAVC